MLGNDFFKPQSIAVIGASANPAKIGFNLVRNLLDGQFEGIIYPVNLNETNILGLKCFQNILEVPDKIGLVIIAIPAQKVADILIECGQKRVKNVIIISAGFSESGLLGRAMQEEIISLAKKYNIRILGPNCLGVISPANRLNASFSMNMPSKKNIAVISQSGATCTAILDWANKREIGFSHFVSLGNKADLNENDFLEYFAKDNQTKVVLGYLESVSHGPKLLSLAEKITREKPFILLKAGRSEMGQKAARSHTAALAADDLVLTEAFQEAGIIRAENLENLFDWSMVFSELDLPESNKVLVMTNAGGPAVMTTDEISTKKHLGFYDFSLKMKEKITKSFDGKISVNNPLDLLGDATSKDFKVILDILKTKREKSPDLKIIILTPQANTDIDRIAKLLAENKDRKTVIVLIGGKSFDQAYKILAEAKIPTFLYPESAVSALDQLSRYAEYKREKIKKPHYTKGIKEVASKIIAKDGYLTDSDIAKILAAYQIPMADSKLTTSVEEGLGVAQGFGYPVVLKVTSPDILHKTEAGAVKLGINSDEEFVKAYQEVLENSKRFCPKAEILGITVYHMVRSSIEFALGAKRDPIFGPFVMFGLGGIYIEIFKDFRIRLAPVSLDEAHDMIKRVHSYKLLAGYRNTQKFDLEMIAKAISGLSALMLDFPSISEVDINPIRLAKKNGGILALDGKVIFDKDKSK